MPAIKKFGLKKKLMLCDDNVTNYDAAVSIGLSSPHSCGSSLAGVFSILFMCVMQNYWNILVPMGCQMGRRCPSGDEMSLLNSNK